MKLKKILVSILVPLNSVNEINEKIGDEEINNDVLGFHIVLTNKINKKFTCDFLINSDADVLWSIDKKKTVNKCLNIEYQTQRCRIITEREEEIEIFIWSENGQFTLKSLSNTLPNTYSDLSTIYINDTDDAEFIALFSFKKKYHFDNYRKLLIYGLYEQQNLENQRFIVEMIEKIIKNAKNEREMESECETDEDFIRFYNKVFRNLLEENVGMLDKFSEYREKIIKKLTSFNPKERIETKIILGRNDAIKVSKKIDLTPKNEQPKPIKINSLFNQNEINKTYKLETINHNVFVVSEISKKKMFYEPKNSIILFKYDNTTMQELEFTIQKIINNCYDQTYEIIVYFSYSIDIFENIVKNSDNLFRLKIVSPKNKNVKLSDIQKLIILSNTTSCINDHVFLVGIGCIIPKKYMENVSRFMEKDLKNDEILLLNNCNILNKSNGRIDYYETNTNKLFIYFVECLFPVIPKNLCKKLNFNSPIFGGMTKFKDFKNFLMKNGTINDVIIYTKMSEIFLKDGLYISEM